MTKALVSKGFYGSRFFLDSSSQVKCEDQVQKRENRHIERFEPEYRWVVRVDVRCNTGEGSDDFSLDELLEQRCHRDLDLVRSAAEELGPDEGVEGRAALLLDVIGDLSHGRQTREDRGHVRCETLAHPDEGVEVFEECDPRDGRLVALNGIEDAGEAGEALDLPPCVRSCHVDCRASYSSAHGRSDESAVYEGLECLAKLVLQGDDGRVRVASDDAVRQEALGDGLS